MSEGWGKRAATRIDRSQFGNDELLKSLGQQFNLDFANYDQWQRKKPSRPPPPPKQKGGIIYILFIYSFFSGAWVVLVHVCECFQLNSR